MILLLPLRLFRVTYEVGFEQPFSKLETLILRAVDEEKARTIDALEKIFFLPKRLIIDILVTLVREGWIAINIDTGGSFEITQPGRKALESGAKPKSFKVRQAEALIIQERVTGQLIHNHDTSYDNQRDLEWNKDSEGYSIWDKAYRMPNEFAGKRLDEGQVRRLLRWKRTEWIRWIDTPSSVSKDLHWLLVNVDLEKQETSLPERWKGGLEAILLEKAKEFAELQPSWADVKDERRSRSRLQDSELEPDEVSFKYFLTWIDSKDVLLTHSEHIQQLKAVLTEQAKSRVLIASAFLNTACLDPDVRGWLLAALNRGIHVDILWGYKAEHDGKPQKMALKWLKDLLKEAGAKGKLRFNQERTENHAKLLIYDTDTGYRAYVGSYNWLSTPTLAVTASNERGSNVTVGLDHPGLVADLCSAAAHLWEAGRGNRMSDAPNRWRRIAEQQERKVSELPNNTAEDTGKTNSQICKVRIVRNQEHEALMREYLLTAQKRCAIVSHKIGAKASIRLASLEKRSYQQEFKLVVRHGEYLTVEQQTALMQKMQAVNGTFTYKTGLHSKVIVADDKAIISSYNFLSAQPDNNPEHAGEVGVWIEGGVVPDILWKVLAF